jgi:hypothetical protein
MQGLRDLAATDFAAAGLPQGKARMASLPSLLHDLASQWNLTTTGGVLGHGYNAVVLPVRQDGRPLALKLTWPPGRARKEADAGTRNRTARWGSSIIYLVVSGVSGLPDPRDMPVSRTGPAGSGRRSAAIAALALPDTASPLASTSRRQNRAPNRTSPNKSRRTSAGGNRPRKAVRSPGLCSGQRTGLWCR